MGIEIENRPFAKSTLQLFRAHLVLHDKVRAVFQKSLEFARQTGYMKKRKIKVVLDTSHILGKGAVKDTYNLLADGIAKLVKALAAGAGKKPKAWASERGLSRYFGSSLKGEANIDWGDEGARRTFLNEVVADADRLLEMAREALESSANDDVERERLTEVADMAKPAAGLLAQRLSMWLTAGTSESDLPDLRKMVSLKGRPLNKSHTSSRSSQISLMADRPAMA